MQTTAVLWEIHRRTSSELSLGQSALPLGLVGLVQVLPVISLALLAGHVADRFNRRYVIMTALLVIVISSTGLALVSARPTTPTILIYGCLFLAGVARAFQQPAKSSLMPQLVPRADFPNAVTWNSAAFQMAAVLGTSVGGRTDCDLSQRDNRVCVRCIGGADVFHSSFANSLSASGS